MEIHTERRLTLPGKVFGLGKGAFHACWEYAERTGRPYLLCDTVDEISPTSSDVVVCNTSELSAHLMHKLYADETCTSVPGLIFAPTSSLLLEVCRRQAKKLTRNQRFAFKRVFVYSGLEFARIDRGIDTFVGGIESAESISALLSYDAAVLLLWGHSDGIGLRITSKNLLCPFADSPAKADDELRPTCQIVGQCSRFPIMPTVSEAARAGWILPLRGIRAGVGIVCACSAIRVNDGVVNSSYCLAASLLAYADLGVLVTTSGPSFHLFDGSHMNPLINDLCAGTMVGNAVATINRSVLFKYLGLRLSVVGDPCFTLAPSSAYPQLPPPKEISSAAISKRMVNVKDSLIERAAFLRDFIRYCLNANPRSDSRKGESLEQMLALYADPAKQNEPHQLPDVKFLGSELLQFLSSFARVNYFDFYYPFVGINNVDENGTCPVCFAPARIFKMFFLRHSVQLRRIVTCDCCGQSEDMPIDWQIKLDLARIKDGIVSIDGASEDTQSLVCLLNMSESLHQSYNCGFSKGLLFFRIPTDLPQVPLFCRVLFAKSLALGVLSFKLRQMQDGTLRTSIPSGLFTKPQGA
jgi:hypothetical protein